MKDGLNGLYGGAGITILLTDKAFDTSPDAGEDCACSRCGKPILRAPVIRALDDEKLVEYRYHPSCLGMTVLEDEDDEDFEF